MLKNMNTGLYSVYCKLLHMAYVLLLNSEKYGHSIFHTKIHHFYFKNIPMTSDCGGKNQLFEKKWKTKIENRPVRVFISENDIS